jgi:UDP-glucuronate 4-epimerase
MGRFLITGALGAVGVWTMRSLLERGHDIVAFDLGGDGHRLPIALEPDQIEAVLQVTGDITDLNAVERVIDEHAITNVIHLAALQVPFVRADPALGARVNVVGTVNVFEAVRRRADRIGPLVYASSIAVFGEAGTLAADDHPGTLYGVTKRANESGALRYFADYGVSSIGLRPHTVYGPGRDQGLTSAPTTAMLATAAGVKYHIPFGGSVQLQYAPDIGEAFARTAELEYEGASVHNLDGPEVAISDLVERLTNVTADGQPLPFPSAVDGSSFVELLGGSVMRPVDEGVADAIQRFERLLAAGLVRPPR